MTEALFDLAFVLAAPFWALMIILPHWSWTRRVVGSPLIVVAPLLVYLIVMIPLLPDFVPEMLDPDLAGVRAILGTADGTTAVWAHLIAFDLFVGRWLYLDSRERGVPALLMAPVLVLTILLSPFGLLSYFGVRAVVRRRGPAAAGGGEPAPVGSAGDQRQQRRLRRAGEPDRGGGVRADAG